MKIPHHCSARATTATPVRLEVWRDDLLISSTGCLPSGELVTAVPVEAGDLMVPVYEITGEIPARMPGTVDRIDRAG